jgi:hypothetical protein
MSNRLRPSRLKSRIEKEYVTTMPKKKLTPAEQEQKEREALESPVRLDGKGEHPAVQALLSPEFEQMSNMDAMSVALILQDIVRGQQSLIARYDQTAEEIARLREKQERADKEIAERLEAQQKFIEDVLDRAEKLQQKGEERDKLIAQGVAQYEKAKQVAAADMATKNLMFDQKLASEPKVTVVWPGEIVTVMEAGQQVVKVAPSEVRIRHRLWRYAPGQTVEVPKTVANFLEQRRASQQETLKRQEILQKNLEAPKLAEEWSKVGGSKTDAMPI